MKYKKILVLSFLFISLNVLAAEINVKDLDLKLGKGIGILSVKLNGNVIENPDLLVKNKNIELKIPNAHVVKTIIKKGNGINFIATQFNRDTVKVIASLANSLVGKESLVSLTIKEGSIDLNFPTDNNPTTISRSPAIENEVVNKDIDKIDESYLNKIENQNLNLDANKLNEKKVLKVAQNEDNVKLQQSSLEKNSTKVEGGKNEVKSNFSIVGYVGKFVAFLSLMLLGFYGVLTLFKKGVIKKGKLGFLHSTKIVEVLNTTHIAPKRSLIMIKAHNQVFLISNSETGVQLISEIKDVTGLLKTGEQELTGTNFDTNLEQANIEDREVKLKETDFVDYDSLDEMLSAGSENTTSELTSAARSIEKKPVKDQVKLSDQIKSKIKNLKQLQ